MKDFPLLTLAAAAAAAAAAAFPAGFEQLSYQREAILAGEWWRLLTGHLVHASGTHLLWCSTAFLVLGASVEREMGRAYVGFLALSAVAVAAGLFVLMPRLSWYCGLSGIDTALFVHVLWREAEVERLRGGRLPLALALLAGLGLAAKIAFEYSAGLAVFAPTPDVAPVPTAHVLGVVAGVVGAALGGRRRDGLVGA